MVLRPVTRNDGELVGWVRPTGRSFDAVTLLGHCLAPDLSEESASELLRTLGIAAVMEPWWTRAPFPFPNGTDLRSPDKTWGWRKVVVVELTTTHATVRIKYPAADEMYATTTVSLPADDVLLTDPH